MPDRWLNHLLLLSRTPGPSPFPSMKITPAASRAWRITAIVARRGSVVPLSNWRTLLAIAPRTKAISLPLQELSEPPWGFDRSREDRRGPVPQYKIARNVDPTSAVSQSIDLAVKDRNLVGSLLEAISHRCSTECYP